ncbi:type II secretion system protein [Alloiococcus sp. CFN-8]|uniref:type II secretion system protein n=1 Tax=Alloiococcus sp. CFN-8 TaxID=3416081 RepID=UPI003CF4E8CC
MNTKRKGTTIIELIIVLGIMALISMIIAMILSFTIAVNSKVIAANDKEYKSHEFYRFVSNSIKDHRISNIVIENQKISIFYHKVNDRSDKMDIIQDNENVHLHYYRGTNGIYTRRGSPRVVLEKINSISFIPFRNLLYIKIHWQDGEVSLGLIDL